MREERRVESIDEMMIGCIPLVKGKKSGKSWPDETMKKVERWT